MGTSVPERPTEGLLPCPVCGRTIHKGEWFIIASQAVADVRTGTPYQSTEDGTYVPQRPIHVKCLVDKIPIGGHGAPI